MTLFVPLLALSLAAQTPDFEIKGSVVEASGKPAAGASVLLYLECLGQAEPGLASTATDGHGQFRLARPRLGGPGRGRIVSGNRSLLFAYRQGSGLGVGWFHNESHKLVLPASASRAVTMRRADGKPLAGFKVMPRQIHVFSGPIAEIPASLAAQLAATTGPDGTATLTSLAARDELMAVRVAGPSLAEQDIVLVDRPGTATRTGPATLKVEETSQISGRIIDEHGQGVPGQVVEVWTRGSSSLYPSPVEFAGGPVRTGADGYFQTPPSLLVRSTYRVVIRATGKDLILGDWVTLGSKPREFPAIVLGVLRTIRGRVVDRAGKPINGAEVVQRGDGPECTSTRTDANGNFSLGGFRSGSVIVFVRHQGFGFHGQLVQLKLELLERALLKARTAEEVGARLQYIAAVANKWCTLGETEKARKLIVETLPVAIRYTEKTDIRRGFFAASLARFDLPAALTIANEFSGRRDKDRVLGLMARELANTNPAEAERLWNEMRGTSYSESLEVCWRLASADPVRARRIAAREVQRGNPYYYIALAHGLAPLDKAAARDALQQGLDQVDQLMEDPQSEYRARTFLTFALGVVDQVDPALAPEVFWRYLAMRPPFLSPRIARGASSGGLIRYVAMYDRDLAGILFEPIRARMSRAEDRSVDEMQMEFLAWTVLDPAGAIAAAERLPINPDRLDQSGGARLWVAAALTSRERWRLPGMNGPFDFLLQP